MIDLKESSGTKIKVVVYTAIFGDKDNLAVPLNFGFESDFKLELICVSDNKNLDSTYYKIIQSKRVYRDLAKNARNIKINGFDGIQEFDVAIWHDSSMAFDCSKINELVEFSRSHAISTFKHQESCLYREAIVCIQLRKDAPLRITKQMFRYFRAGLVANSGQFETGVVVTRVKDFGASELREKWWEEVLKGSRRDQLALGFVWYCLKEKEDIGILPGSGHDNIYTKYLGHNYDYYLFNGIQLNFNSKLLRKLCIVLLCAMRRRR